MKVEKLFSEADKTRVAETVRNAEAHTSGEIVPLVVNASDHYVYVHFIGAVIGQILFLGVGIWILPECDLVRLLIFQALGFLLGYLLSKYVPPLKRSLLSHGTADAEVYDRALRAFYENELYRTRDRTGILIFVSLLERRVQVLADTGINARVPPGTWDEVVRIILEGIRLRDLSQGLCNAITRCGEILAREFPRKSDDTDELGDQLRIEK